MSTTAYDAFLRSLAETAPPPGLDARLLAIWRGLKGEWDAAHAMVQDLDDRDAAWVHAWLHRIEGDLGNAGYWYRRAGRPAAKGDTDEEGRAIAKDLIGAAG
jgi:hypothetical protein